MIVYFGLLAVMGAPELDALKRRLLPNSGSNDGLKKRT
ncbi:MAG: hypothetical protein ACI9CV_001797 [Ilumatobacter sp.]